MVAASVIVPVFKVQTYLHCLDATLHQPFADFEVFDQWEQAFALVDATTPAPAAAVSPDENATWIEHRF